MARFKYTARDKDGKAYKGSIEASDEASVRAKLRQMNLFSTGITQLGGELFAGRAKKIKMKEVIIFTERLAVMINAGIPLMRCLKTISDQTENEMMRKVIGGLRLELESGNSFSSALAMYPQVFSNLYINLVKAGETGGLVDEVLQKISEYLNKEMALRQNLIKALSYPIILMGVAAIVVTFLVVFIIPTFAETYEKMGLHLPVPTLILIGLSKLFSGYWWMVLVGIFGMIALVRVAIKTKAGTLALDKLKLKLPIFGPLFHQVAIARFIHSFSLLVASGISLMEALNVVREVTGNKIILDMINRVKEKVRRGIKLADALSKEKLFPPMAAQMISAGEESGKLDLMLKKTADFIERDVDVTVQKLIVRLEPILTFLLALVVGFIALAIYLPMFDLIAKVAKK